MCAGTRGDVQPFIALGLQLKVSASAHGSIFRGAPCRHLTTRGGGAPAAVLLVFLLTYPPLVNLIYALLFNHISGLMVLLTLTHGSCEIAGP